jgi:hypothetical protein
LALAHHPCVISPGSQDPRLEFPDSLRRCRARARSHAAWALAGRASAFVHDVKRVELKVVKCERPRASNKRPARTADMGHSGRYMPPRILHGTRRLQVCGRAQAAAWLTANDKHAASVRTGSSVGSGKAVRKGRNHGSHPCIRARYTTVGNTL